MSYRGPHAPAISRASWMDRNHRIGVAQPHLGAEETVGAPFGGTYTW